MSSGFGVGGLGEFALGGFPDGDSLSVADPLAGLIADPAAPREFLLRALPRDSNGATVAVDVSSGGYVSKSTDSPFKHFQPAIVRPGDFTVSLPIPDLNGGTKTGVGAAVLNNADGLRDLDAIRDWLGVDVEIYMGEPDSALADFTRILRGPAAGVSRSLDRATVVFRDTRFRLQRPLQRRKYWGAGAALRFNGTSTVVSFGDVLDKGASDSFTAEVLLRRSTTGAARAVLGKKSAVGTAAGWGVNFNSSNNLIARIADGAAEVTAQLSAASGYLDGALYRLSMVVDRAAQRIRLYVDGELVATSASIAAIGSLANAIPLQLGGYNSTLLWDGDLDDFRMWPTARTQEQIRDTMHRELHAAEAATTSLYAKLNEGALASAGDDSGNGLTGTITAGSWIGSLEGDESIAGRPKPRAVGVRRQVAPLLVDSQNLVYQFNDGGMQSVTALRDSGEGITFGTDLADIYSAAPTAGTYNTCLARGLVRLGSAPVGVITGDIEGDNAGTHGYQDTVAGIGRKVLEQWGGLDDGTEFDSVAFTALETLDGSAHGFFWDGEVNVDAATDEVFSSGWSWWGPNRVGEITCGRIVDPAGQAATVTLGEGDLVDPSRGGAWQSDPFSVRIGEVRVLFRPYQTVLDDEQVAGSVDLADKHDFGQVYRVARAIVADASDDADVLEITTSIDDRAAAQALAEAIRDLLETDRELLRVSLASGALAYYIGTIVEIVLARYSLDSGKHFAIVSLSELYGEAGTPDRVEVTLFG